MFDNFKIKFLVLLLPCYFSTATGRDIITPSDYKRQQANINILYRYGIFQEQHQNKISKHWGDYPDWKLFPFRPYVLYHTEAVGVGEARVELDTATMQVSSYNSIFTVQGGALIGKVDVSMFVLANSIALGKKSNRSSIDPNQWNTDEVFFGFILGYENWGSISWGNYDLQGPVISGSETSFDEVSQENEIDESYQFWEVSIKNYNFMIMNDNESIKYYNFSAYYRSFYVFEILNPLYIYNPKIGRTQFGLNTKLKYAKFLSGISPFIFIDKYKGESLPKMGLGLNSEFLLFTGKNKSPANLFSNNFEINLFSGLSFDNSLFDTISYGFKAGVKFNHIIKILNFEYYMSRNYYMDQLLFLSKDDWLYNIKIKMDI